jgi:lipoprotein-anchoring transpeptidase ErfK/SrfK
VPTRVERRRQERRRRQYGAGGVLGVLVAATVGVVALSGGSPVAAPRREPPPSTTTTTTVPVTDTTVGTSKKLHLKVFEQPDVTAPAVGVLPLTTEYGLPTTLLIEPTQPDDPVGWLQAVVPFRKPNGTRGWVRASDVQLSTTTYEIDISLSEHLLVVTNDDVEVLRTPVIIGTPETPTPTGTFWLTDPVNCNTVSVEGYPVGQCSGAYGTFAIGTSGLSETLESFGGTMPQIAIHGMSLPLSELGKDLSNGCVRMPNDVIVQIARLSPLLGMPVTITA